MRVFGWIGVCLLVLFSASAQAQSDSPTRSFRMGFTPFNYSWIKDKREIVFGLIARHGDVVAQHLDGGVPWAEAYEGKPYEEEVEVDLQDRMRHVTPGQAVFVAVTPINFERTGLAARWGEEENEERSDGWKDADFADPRVLDAYLAYCRDLIRRFRPAYFAYAIEANLLAENNPAAYQAFTAFAQKVYATLKREYPDLPVFATVYAGSPDGVEKFHRQIAPLMDATDFIAISSYPYMSTDGPPRRVASLPADWYARIRSIAPDKPFAIAETGYIAEELEVGDVEFKSSAAEQAHYVRWLLAEAQKEQAAFVIWFLPADYDDLWSVLKWIVLFDPLFRAWKDTGLYDGDLKPRPALEVWTRWYDKPLKR